MKVEKKLMHQFLESKLGVQTKKSTAKCQKETCHVLNGGKARQNGGCNGSIAICRTVVRRFNCNKKNQTIGDQHSCQMIDKVGQ